jgi:Zn-finger nucleic acid-binding protein
MNQPEPSPTDAASAGPQLESRLAAVACPHGCGEMAFGFLMGIKIVGCPTCGGMLLEANLMAQAVQILRAEYGGPDVPPKPLNESELHVNRHCPACWETMEVHPYYGPGAVVIDSCSHCNLVWLDGQELHRIQKAPGRRRPTI